VCDYPLAQVVEDRIVKAPLIVTNEDDAKQPMQDPDHITGENVCEKYGYWMHAAVQRWQEHSQTFRPLGTQPVLFIMAEKNAYADALGAYLWKTEEFGFKESEVLSSIRIRPARSPRKTSTKPARRRAILTSRGARSRPS
jgi:type III restriction enzyme